MNWITVAIVVGALAWILAYHRDPWSGWAFVAAGITILAGIIGVAALGNWWSFPAQNAELAQIRSAVERLGCSASEDVIGKAADWNAQIASARVWNSRFIADPFYHDGVDTVSTVVIPDCK